MFQFHVSLEFLGSAVGSAVGDLQDSLVEVFGRKFLIQVGDFGVTSVGYAGFWRTDFVLDWLWAGSGG